MVVWHRVRMGNMVWRVLGTVKKHLEHIYEKLGVETRAAAAALAKTMFTRKAAAYYEQSAGHLPQPMRDREEARSV